MSTDFHLDAFLPFRLNRLAAEVSERMSQIYADQFDLDIPMWRVLATLSTGTGSGTTAQDIVASTRTHKSTISRAVQALEARGLIERTVLGADRRANALRLTSAGKKLFKRLQPLVLAFEAQLLACLAAPDEKNLLSGLSAFERSLDLGRGENS
jgi:DNA-binding MarR family transcriptional regulator